MLDFFVKLATRYKQNFVLTLVTLGSSKDWRFVEISNSIVDYKEQFFSRDLWLLPQSYLLTSSVDEISLEVIHFVVINI